MKPIVAPSRSPGSPLPPKRSAFVLLGSGLQGVVRQELAAAGFATAGASEPNAAWAQIFRHPYELVILDHPLPGNVATGDFARALRREPAAASRRAWIVVLAPGIEASELRGLRNSGVSGLFVEPLSLGALRAAITTMERDSREFIDTEAGYVGPDRRLRAAAMPADEERRARKRRAAAGGTAVPTLPAAARRLLLPAPT